MKKIGIYKITSPSGKIYIGQSVDIFKRWNNYKLLDCKKQKKLYNSFKHYGVENHNFEIVKECEIHELNYYERHYQEFYNVLDKEYGLNLKYTKTNDKRGIHSEETRKKISESQKGNKHNLGKTLSEETRKKISEKAKGRNPSYESRKKMSKSQTGKKLCEITKKKMSDSHKCKKEGFVHPLNKKVINLETNEIYNSLREMCKTLNLSYSTMGKKLTGIMKNNTSFKYF